MKLHNEFEVQAPIDDTWALLLDIERVAGCLPGATVEANRSDGDYVGRINVKLGPMTLSYKGSMRLTEVDQDAHRALLEVKAKELKGQGTATALIQNELEAADERLTRVRVATELNVTGRPAQLGRAIMQDVAAALLADFARNLESELRPRPARAQDDVRSTVPAPTPRASGQPDTAPPRDALDVGSALWAPVARRFGAAVAVLLMAVALIRLRGRGRR